jgi:hypothetical protein
MDSPSSLSIMIQEDRTVTAVLATNVADLAGRILVAGGLLLLAIIVLSLGVWYYRRRLLGAEESSANSWTLDEFRRLRAQGDLTEEEYQALRATLIGRYAGGASGKGPDASPEFSDGSNPHQPDLDLKKEPPA